MQDATLGRLFTKAEASDISVELSKSEESPNRVPTIKNPVFVKVKNIIDKKKNTPVPDHATWSEAMSASSEEETEDRQATSNKQNKGLKLLSVVVKDIVIAKKWTTYKEVAEIILNDSLDSGDPIHSMQIGISREEQNIKRRVYDALNVLISAGVLIKDGKRVRKNGSSKLIKLNQLQSYIVTLSETKAAAVEGKE
jgi:hypothetical protein